MRPGMHLYARFPSPLAVREFLKYGVTSFDNTSPFITASRSACSYIDPSVYFNMSDTGNCYNLKIPGSRSPFLRRAKKVLIEEDFLSLVNLCSRTFDAFVSYSSSGGSYNLKTLINLYYEMNVALNQYRTRPLSPKKISKLMDVTKSTLLSRPWMDCDCSSCLDLKAHIVLTRNNFRIVHTFFHNSYIQYSRFVSELDRAMVEVEFKNYSWEKVDSLVKKKTEKILK